ncbi:vWA domain-containing protein [Marinobacter sp. C2H3]|uniref:vWA domain-containing protein n=1 Tax=Marinobacter sp. C2H3 TaxID=3119003 RepID=UPI00300F4113
MMRWLLALCLGLAAASLTAPWASETALAQAAATGNEAADPGAQDKATLTVPGRPDVRLIVDISGSMKQTDPENLRQPAVRLLAGLLPGNAEAGLWTFGQWVNMLVPHDDVSAAWRERMRAGSTKINSVALRTNLGKAIEVAGDDLGPNHKGTVDFILLTDGKVDLSDDPAVNAAEERRILDDVVPRLVARGARFHPVALSDQADAAFLKKLADASDGRFHLAQNASDLNRAFADALNAAEPQQQIPIEGNGFSVDAGVKEFTALIFPGEGDGNGALRTLTLVAPDGRRLTPKSAGDSVRWAREPGYDLITIDTPAAGQWQIDGDLGDGSRVTVVSDLRMEMSDIPAHFSTDKPIELSAAFFEKSDKIVNPDFLKVVTVSLTLTAADGRSGTKVLSGDQPPKDGVYGDTIGQLPAEGDYTLTLLADGKTFQRKLTATTHFDAPPATDAGDTPAADRGQEPAEGPAPGGDGAEPVDTGIQPIDPSQVETPEAPASEAVPEGDSGNAVEDAPESPADSAPGSAADAPAADAAPAQAPEEGFLSRWMNWLIGGGVGLLALVALVFAVLRRKRGRDQALVEAASERETAADLEEDTEVPVVAPDIDETPEPDAEPEPATEPELEPEPAAEQAPERDDDIPALTDEDPVPALDEPVVAEDDERIPELPPEPEPADADEPGPFDEGQPSPEDEDIPVAQAALDDDEFGLDDFDLSEFDDLPGYDEDADQHTDNDKDDDGETPAPRKNT